VSETNQTTEFKVTLGVLPEEVSVEGVRLDALAGLGPDDLEEIGRDTGADVTVRPGSTGVGAAGPGIELILAYVSIPGDLLALIEIGKKIKSAIKKIRARRARSVTISDSDTMAAVAAASVTGELIEKLHGASLKAVRNLFGGEPPNWLGTDSRHIWAVVFEHETQGYALIIFMSPSGLVLGHVQVPVETYWDGSTYRSRTPEDIARFSHD